MKQCEKCGASLEDNAKFCSNCGNSFITEILSSNDNSNNQAAQTQNNNENINNQVAQAQNDNNNYVSQVQNINDIGYNNQSNNFQVQDKNLNNMNNMNNMNNQGPKQLSISKKNLTLILAVAGGLLLLGIIIFAVFSKSDSKDKDKDDDYRVSSSKEEKEVDPFDGLEVKFSGTSPNARVDIDYRGDEKDINSYAFKANKEENIKVGEEITVTFDEKHVYSSDYEIKPTETEKKFKCEKVDKYVSDVSEIPKDAMDKLKKDVETKIDVYFSTNSDNFKSDTAVYEGSYFLYTKDESSRSYNDKNGIYLIYSSNLTADKGYKKIESTKIYHPYYIEDIILKADGSFTYEFNAYNGTPKGNCEVQAGDYSFHFSGYTDFDKMCLEQLGDKKDKFTIKANDGIKEYK